MSPDILGHELTLAADRYTVVDDTLIPTGELRPAVGTPFDFRTPHVIRANIGQAPSGDDRNWALNPANRSSHAAMAYDPVSERTLDVTTDQPGVQSYAGNFLDGALVGCGGTCTAGTRASSSKPSTFPTRLTSRYFRARCCGPAKRSARAVATPLGCGPSCGRGRGWQRGPAVCR